MWIFIFQIKCHVIIISTKWTSVRILAFIWGYDHVWTPQIHLEPSNETQTLHHSYGLIKSIKYYYWISNTEWSRKKIIIDIWLVFYVLFCISQLLSNDKKFLIISFFALRIFFSLQKGFNMDFYHIIDSWLNIISVMRDI